MSVEINGKQGTRYSGQAQNVVGEFTRRERAHALNEDLAQLLAALRLHVHSLDKEDSRSEKIGERIGELDKIIGEAFALLRQIAIELYPFGLEQESLYSAMRSLTRSLSERYAVSFKLIADESKLDVGEICGLAVFRIAQHSLEAIAQRMPAGDVLIRLHVRGERLVLTIDSQESCGLEKRPQRTREDTLNELREQVRATGGRTRMIRREHGERLEISLPRYFAGLQ